jgi:drug/metabolite transporter (DMT)-like permease
MRFYKENWDTTRKKGFLNFLLVRGFLLFGLPLTLFQFFIRLSDGNKINYVALLLSGIIGGVIYSSSMWFFAERKFKKENPINRP